MKNTFHPSDVCKTIEGQVCIFPFKYGDNLYQSCTDVDDSRPWCATLVDENREQLGYSYCEPQCEGSKDS